ncbi:MAG: hypothetical protein R3C18_20525 [Planctomycetaceae bacterium]
MSETTRTDELSPTLGIGVSLLFWTCFLVCGVLFAAAALAPHIVEHEDLQAQWEAQQQQRLALDGQRHHLELLRDSLQDDPEFINRIASSDLNQSPDAQFALAVPESLRHNPRQARTTEAATESRAVSPYMPLLRDLSKPSSMRTRWIWATAIFCVLSFGFLHEGVFTGPLGKLLTHAGHVLRSRYRRTDEAVPVPDEQPLV